MATVAQFVLEAAPFFSTIIFKFLSPGAATKFENQLGKTEIGKSLESADKGTIENAAQHSFEFEQCIRYYDLAIIAIFIIFGTKSVSSNSSGTFTVVGGFACLLLILGLRLITQRYFSNRSPNKSVNIDCYTNDFSGFSIRYANIGIGAANIIPIIALLSLRLPNWISAAMGVQ